MTSTTTTKPTKARAKPSTKPSSQEKPSLRPNWTLKRHQLEQQSPEWFQIRKLKLTASGAQAIGNAKVGLETLVKKLMTAYLSSAEPERFTSKDTERGNECEPICRSMYELEKGVDVDTVGFVEADEHIGCSPDGLIGEEGGLEIKCPKDEEYYSLMLEGESAVNMEYKWQCQMTMLILGTKWHDLVFYNPNFKQTMLVFRQVPDEEMQQKLLEGLEKGVALIKQQLALFA